MEEKEKLKGLDRKQAREQRLKIRTARLSILSNTLLVILKLAVGVLVSSVSILSEAAHSTIDLVAALVATYSVRRSGLPPDSEHPFGHGKFENVSGAVEAVLIFAAAGYIVFESMRKLVTGDLRLGHLEAGLAVMAFSGGLNWVISKRLLKVARKTDSLALEADALHLRTDVYSSAGVLAALGAIYLSDLLVAHPGWNKGFHYLDPLVALAVAAIITRAAFDLTRRSIGGLLDRTLPEEEDRIIRGIIQRHETDHVDFHALRHRRAGPERHIDLHLVVARDTTVAEVHALTDLIESEIKKSLPKANILIHVEPCNEACPSCRAKETCRHAEGRVSRP